jgi:signal transduction histidine kinase
MATEPAVEDLYARLRKAVASDVKQARKDFCALLVGPSETLVAILELASRAGEGRVRQMIATAARVEPLTDPILPWLRRWLDLESDEFAHSAIIAALATRESAAPVVSALVEMPPAFVESYRYVAERLCHRVRNTLTIPTAMVVRLEQLCEQTTDPAVRSELMSIVARLRPALQRLSRIVEFDTGDGYVAWQSLALGEWLDGMAAGFASRFGHATFALIASAQARRLRVRCTPFLLDTLFGNLWTNAVQAADQLGLPSCHITAEVNLRTDNAGRESVDVLLRDSGPGFSSQMIEGAFRLPFSTKAETRGRGLLEVADAVQKLQGEVKLVPVAANEHRILIRLPVEKS